MNGYWYFKDEDVPEQFGVAFIPVATLIQQVDDGDSRHVPNVTDSPYSSAPPPSKMMLWSGSLSAIAITWSMSAIWPVTQ